jgi:hypothetical protein
VEDAPTRAGERSHSEIFTTTAEYMVASHGAHSAAATGALPWLGGTIHRFQRRARRRKRNERRGERIR